MNIMMELVAWGIWASIASVPILILVVISMRRRLKSLEAYVDHVSRRLQETREDLRDHQFAFDGYRTESREFLQACNEKLSVIEGHVSALNKPDTRRIIDDPTAPIVGDAGTPGIGGKR